MQNPVCRSDISGFIIFEDMADFKSLPGILALLKLGTYKKNHAFSGSLQLLARTASLQPCKQY